MARSIVISLGVDAVNDSSVGGRDGGENVIEENFIRDFFLGSV